MIYAEAAAQQKTFNDRISELLNWEMDAPMYASLIVIAILLVFFIALGIAFHIGYKKKKYLERPKGFLLLGEMLYDFCHKFTVERMGEKSESFTGYFMALWTYLIIAFIWSLTGMPSIIDWIGAPLSLALVMFVLIQATALRYQHLHYFHRYVEPFAVFLPVNLLTMWTPIISTTMRLLGNALSGSVIIGLVQWALGNVSDSIFGSMGINAYGPNYFPSWDVNQSYAWTSVFLAPIPMGILNLYFSLFSAYVQTMVFATLNALWIAQEKPLEEERTPSLTVGAPRAEL
ncbi:MAG: F0F1 ATP synthase subunit A [Bacilli bacterium]|nr:F0F1 ATP synthase subunit A [Bacilli bacterium]